MITFRRGTVDDLGVVADLLRATFPNNPKAEIHVLRWQFWDDPFGPPIVWIAELDGEPVGTCAAYVQPGLLDGIPTPVVKGADGATLPATRGQGVFPRLLEHITDDMRDRGIPLFLSHPANPASVRPQERLGMRAVSSAVPVQVAPVDASLLADRFPGARLAAPVVRRWLRRGGDALDVAVVDEVPAGLDDLWARHRPTWGLDHDGQWWRWRYARPDIDYTRIEARQGGDLVAAGVGFVRQILDLPFVHVMDLVADTDAAAGAVLGGLVDALPGAAGIAGIALPGTDIARWMRAARMLRVPARFAPRFTFGVRPTDASTGPVERAPWRLTWCDLDHV